MSIKNTSIFIVNVYILTNILFGQNGIMQIYKMQQKIHTSTIEKDALSRKNYIRTIKLDMLNDEKIDLRYLEELLRTQYSFAKQEEFVIFI